MNPYEPPIEEKEENVSLVESVFTSLDELTVWELYLIHFVALLLGLATLLALFALGF
jgi:hypothetical protein